MAVIPRFQHTAARRRLAVTVIAQLRTYLVSTHSRPKAAGTDGELLYTSWAVSTHSRPKAAG